METNDQPTNPPVLDITDLRNILEIIGVCAQRGAFRANELSQVGRTYDRLEAFLKDNTPGDGEAGDSQTEPANQEQE
jgi:hypothetical protein